MGPPAPPPAVLGRLILGSSSPTRRSILASMGHPDPLVVVHGGRVLEKPTTADDVREYVAGYATAPAVTIGATVVTDVATGRRWEGADRAEVHLRPLPAAAIEALIDDGAVFGCAGALMVEHPAVAPHVERLVGDETAVRGLCATTTRGLIDAALRGEGGVLPSPPAAG
ncbi:hypothetical protein I4F81_011132 [Pyropia yezoensis]|uniref:Uncharacterized protein n=1 Tax=Pyropia yezoensis TaxID=2788 RepID=A0ACC3CFL2_PYRYE|nr:hypothetical protein I4F81_011132 [Neopyropia yezoensis]